ncbi:MAG: hypothetical protein K9G42_13575, partial [Pedobacter sp.]|nr:hypothetical protein [Pedobacter sp.]
KESKVQISKGYEAMMFKPISPTKLKALSDLYAEALRKYKKDKTAMNQLMGAKDKPADPETASLVIVAGAMLNMDEWLNKN